jgi:ribosomal protein S18 acetylase RimI-like enzyme
MEFYLKEIVIPEEKSAICNKILNALPDWFGIPAAVVDYTDRVRGMPFYAAFAGGEPAGFAAVKDHNPYTAEIYVIGVMPAYHRSGMGKSLIGRCEDLCRAGGKEFLTVKTLDESGNSESYDKTRLFYRALGFRPLEIFPLLWNEDNPCLFLAKYIAG